MRTRSAPLRLCVSASLREILPRFHPNRPPHELFSRQAPGNTPLLLSWGGLSRSQSSSFYGLSAFVMRAHVSRSATALLNTGAPGLQSTASAQK